MEYIMQRLAMSQQYHNNKICYRAHKPAIRVIGGHGGVKGRLYCFLRSEAQGPNPISDRHFIVLSPNVSRILSHFSHGEKQFHQNKPGNYKILQ